jgi:DNA-binding response OmpR family regulator
MKILLVEDEAKIADLVLSGFQSAGFITDYHADGKEGPAAALTTDYDAIVLDVMLPSIDGLSILRAVRNKVLKTPIHLLTARTDPQDRLSGFAAGADDYLLKPFLLKS